MSQPTFSAWDKNIGNVEKISYDEMIKKLSSLHFEYVNLEKALDFIKRKDNYIYKKDLYDFMLKIFKKSNKKDFEDFDLERTMRILTEIMQTPGIYNEILNKDKYFELLKDCEYMITHTSDKNALVVLRVKEKNKNTDIPIFYDSKNFVFYSGNEKYEDLHVLVYSLLALEQNKDCPVYTKYNK